MQKTKADSNPILKVNLCKILHNQNKFLLSLDVREVDDFRIIRLHYYTLFNEMHGLNI